MEKAMKEIKNRAIRLGQCHEEAPFLETNDERAQRERLQRIRELEKAVLFWKVLSCHPLFEERFLDKAQDELNNFIVKWDELDALRKEREAGKTAKQINKMRRGW